MRKCSYQSLLMLLLRLRYVFRVLAHSLTAAVDFDGLWAVRKGREVRMRQCLSVVERYLTCLVNTTHGTKRAKKKANKTTGTTASTNKQKEQHKLFEHHRNNLKALDSVIYQVINRTIIHFIYHPRDLRRNTSQSNTKSCLRFKPSQITV